MQDIIVTGGTGYIGSHTCSSLIENNLSPIIIDNQLNSNRWIFENLRSKYLGNKIQLYPLSCSGIDNIGPNNISGIIHFAALKSVGESVKNPILYYQNNIESLIAVLKYIEKYRIKNFVFSSSCTVYGQPESCPVDENAPVQKAFCPYGETKIICEKIIEDFYKVNNDLNCTILRYFNPIGARPDIPLGENPKRPAENLVSRLMRYACGKGSFVIYGDDYDTKDGSAVRDYLDVNDLAECHVRCLRDMMQKSGVYRIYNVGRGIGVSVFEIVGVFKEVSGLENLEIKVGSRREGDVSSVYANSKKIKGDLGFSCKTDLYTSLKNAWSWQLYLNEKM